MYVYSKASQLNQLAYEQVKLAGKNKDYIRRKLSQIK